MLPGLYYILHKKALNIFKSSLFLNKIIPTLPVAIIHSIKKFLYDKNCETNYFIIEPEYEDTNTIEINQADNKYLLPFIKINYPEKYIATLERTVVLTASGITIDKQTKNIFIETSYYKDLLLKNEKFNDSLYPFYRTRKIKHTATYLVAPDNYWHFYYEYIARILMLRENGFSNIYIYSSPLTQTWQKETLELFGIDYSKFFFVDPNQIFYLNFNLFVFCSFPGLNPINGIFDKKILSKISNHIQNILKNKNVHLSGIKNIFITRNASRKRKIHNYEEVLQLCRKYNFVEFDFDNIPVIDQLYICNSATNIIGIHGAGLTNVIASRHANVIELISEHSDILCYYQIASSLGNNYFRMECKITGEPIYITPSMPVYLYNDIIVNIKKLDYLLNHIFNTR